MRRFIFVSPIALLVGILQMLLVATAPSSSSVMQLKSRDLSQNCKNLNGGTAVCCQVTFAGDFPIIITLASVSHIPLNMNDVNCILGKSSLHFFHVLAASYSSNS
jgi:hypothetical protein